MLVNKNTVVHLLFVPVSSQCIN